MSLTSNDDVVYLKTNAIFFSFPVGGCSIWVVPGEYCAQQGPKVTLLTTSALALSSHLAVYYSVKLYQFTSSRQRTIWALSAFSRGFSEF